MTANRFRSWNLTLELREGIEALLVRSPPPRRYSFASSVDKRRAYSQLFGESVEAVRFARFTLLDIIGIDDSGGIYEAHDELDGRTIALKIIERVQPIGPDAAERVWREALSLVQLSPLNISPVYEVGQDEGRVFVAMEIIQRPRPIDHAPLANSRDDPSPRR